MNSSSMQFFFLKKKKFDHPILDFLQIEFYIETRFWKNRVTKDGYFPKLVWKKGKNAVYFAWKRHLPILPNISNY